MSAYPLMTSDKLLPLKLIAQRLSEDNEYLDKKECPYPDDVKNWLKAKFLPREDKVMTPVAQEPGLDTSEAWDDVATKARELYRELEQAQVQLGKGDTSELVQLIKTKAALLERLITIGDKALGHKASAEFRAVVLSVLEDVLTPEQRALFMTRLGEHA